MDTQIIPVSPYLLSTPTFVAAVAIFLMGLLAFLRERFSMVSAAFFCMTLFLAIYYIAFSQMYRAATEDAALKWAKAAYLGVPFIPTAAYHFAAAALGIYEKHRKGLVVTWMLSFLFSAVIIGTDTVIGGMFHYRWSYYPKYSAWSIPFLVFFFSVTALSLYLYVSEYRKASDGAQKHRIRLFIVNTAIAYAGVVDFIPKFGISAYPFGYLPMFIFVGLSLNIVVRYFLVDITPAFAAKEIIDIMDDVLLVLDHKGIIRLANPAGARLFGCTENELKGKPAGIFFDDPLFSERFDVLIGGGTLRNYEVSIRKGQSAPSTLSLAATVKRDKEGKPAAVICIARDISERKRMEEAIKHQAYHDSLTGLPNRVLFADHLALALRQVHYHEGKLAVMFLDLDTFKSINDTLGHAFGDKLLQSVAARIKGCIRGTDTVARIGGDEFIVLLPYIVQERDAAMVAGKILSLMKEPYRIEGCEISVTASVGISICPDDGEDGETLMKNADSAMYHVKERGRNNYAFFSAYREAGAAARE